MTPNLEYRDLLKLRETFFAGKAALEQSEITKITNDFRVLINTLSMSNINSNLEKYIDICSEMIEASFPGQLSPELASSIPAEEFYKFGEYLYSLNSGMVVLEKLVYHRIIAAYLDLFRKSEMLVQLADQQRWAVLIENLINAGEYTFHKLFKQRVADYQVKTLFNVIHGKKVNTHSWTDINSKVDQYSIAIAAKLTNDQSKVAFLMENSLDMALLDLACLTSGIVNIMIPANSVAQHIEFILNQTHAELILISDEKQLSKIKSLKTKLPHLQKVIMLQGSSIEDWVMPFEEFLETSIGGKENLKQFEVHRLPKSLATIMYTSGTTGEPKGIMFTDMNIVYKRFCRAMALPYIGENDRYLAFLPLFHTFGRFLEMVGAIFWGGEYSFMENPSAATMIENMNLIKPTIFISIPKKWMQLFDNIKRKVDIELDVADEILNAVKATTGGELRWGLSAAGYLPAEVFTFFQQNNIELMSGFGMTEATGGITMTPPGRYIENSLGKELPGVEMKVADDGELLIRGGYVMSGYYGVKRADTFLEGNWFPTGDVMTLDSNGFIEIVDRKKEIYKNIKGETIAPQRIENFFRDSEFVKQVFLVGDHRPFNTILILPDFDDLNFNSANMNATQKQEYFSSVVVTVNKFLAPFERILDFKLIERPFSDEYGELTAKGTYKRRAIEKNFADLIETMYQKNYTELFVKDIEVRIPNWFMREKGCLSRDIIASDEGIIITKLNLELFISRNEHHEKVYRIGDYDYEIDKSYIDFQTFLINPNYWLGNNGLFRFTGDSIIRWARHFNTGVGIKFIAREPHWHDIKLDPSELSNILKAGEKSFYGLHRALLLLQSMDEEHGLVAIKYLELLLKDDRLPIYKYVLNVFYKPQLSQFLDIRRAMFKTIIRYTKAKIFGKISSVYIQHNYDLLDECLIGEVCQICRGKEYLSSMQNLLTKEIQRVGQDLDAEFSSIPHLFALLSKYGIQHPTMYEEIRKIFVGYQLKKQNTELVKLATEARKKLRKGFRVWLGENQKNAVDDETGEEYGWRDVIICDESIKPDDKEKIYNAITETPVLREAIFLFSGGKLIRLNNIVPGGIWISYLREYEQKTVYRVSVQTNRLGSFEITLNLNKKLSYDGLTEEVNWLILAGTHRLAKEFVEDFGGYWPEVDLWTANFVVGDSVEKILRRKKRKLDENESVKLNTLWPFFIWNAAAAYFNFWRLTGFKLELGNVDPSNFIIPPHDYQTGTRINSLTERVAFKNLIQLFENFHLKFVDVVEEQYTFLKTKIKWQYIFSGLINADGEEDGLRILSELKEELEHSDKKEHKVLLGELNRFLDKVKLDGYIPKQIFFAVKRYMRWVKLNDGASFSAKAEMLKDLSETYQLAELEKNFPEARARFFLETVFRDSSQELKAVLLEVIMMHHDHKIDKDEVLRLFSQIQSEFELSSREDYFLTRLSYPHLKPSDEAALLRIHSDGAPASNLVVQFDDFDGNPFLIRKPITPKEISKLHKLFIDANLLVNFRYDHQFLVAISERGFIIGGLFYNKLGDDTVYMDKIVVSNRYRRNGVSERLMHELFNRLESEQYKYITTGFFRPEYFYHFGFKIEKKYSGLVKVLGTKEKDKM